MRHGPRPAGGYDLGDDARAMLQAIRDRDERWAGAIARARHELADRRASLSRIKRLGRAG